MQDDPNRQITAVHIRGYKSIREAHIPLGRRNVLIGANGAGKSNFLSAFEFLDSVVNDNVQLYAARRGVNALLYRGPKVTQEMGFEIEFGTVSYGLTFSKTDDNRLVSSDGDQKYGALKIALGGPRWRVYHFHDTGRDARMKQEHNVSNDVAFLSDGANLAAFLYLLQRAYADDYQRIVRTIQRVAPFFHNFELRPLEENPELILLRWRQKDYDGILNASQLSDGTLRFMCLATLLLQPQKFQPNLFIIDEPELGLHPYAITMFTEMLRQLPDTHQVIVSTQSAELLNEFDAEDVLVVDRDETGSSFRRLDQENLREWLEKDYTLGELWNKNILGGRFAR